MPRTNGEITQLQAAVRGIITEASPLNFPEGATLDEQNFVLRRDGSRRRRFGLGAEANSTPQSVNTSDIVTVIEWFDAGEDADIDYVVIQVGNRLYVYNANSNPLSDGFVDSFFINNWTGRKIEATIINGDFVYAQGADELGILSLNGGTIQQSMYSLKIRDLWGIDDGLDVDERQSTLTDAHAYNLANQGWKRADAAAVGWPSNADVYATGTEGSSFDASLYGSVEWGNTPSAKGSAIIDPLAPSAGREQRMIDRGFTGSVNTALYNDRTVQGATSVASYAGRVFYAGFGKSVSPRVNSTYPDLNTYILFSQVVDDNTALERCHQESDPANLSGDLVDSDGGFVSIPAAGRILKLVPTGRSLIVITTAGVWEIYSTDQIFSPLNYQLQKITNIGAVNKESVVIAQNTVFYWSDYGIHILSIGEVSQTYQSQNLIEQTIQTLYDTIPTGSKKNAIGFFDRFDKKLRWLYDSQNRINVYDTELVYDITLQAWVKNSFATRSDGFGVTAYVPLPATIREEDVDQIVVGADNVVVGADNITVETSSVAVGERTFKYLLDTDTTIEFIEYNNIDYEDWGETDANAFALTGHYTAGDTVRKKHATYLTMHFNRTETGFEADVDGNWIPTNESSCLTRVRWEWTNDIVAGKFTNEFEAYRHPRTFFPGSIGDPFNDGYPVVVTKNRIRGNGRAMNIFFQTAPQKDLDILGWNIQIGANSKV